MSSMVIERLWAMRLDLLVTWGYYPPGNVLLCLSKLWFCQQICVVQNWSRRAAAQPDSSGLLKLFGCLIGLWFLGLMKPITSSTGPFTSLFNRLISKLMFSLQQSGRLNGRSLHNSGQTIKKGWLLRARHRIDVEFNALLLQNTPRKAYSPSLTYNVFMNSRST